MSVSLHLGVGGWGGKKAWGHLDPQSFLASRAACPVLQLGPDPR